MPAPMTIKQYVSQMRKIPGGRFTMGRTYDIEDSLRLFDNEVPVHPVEISAFQMGATPVTVGMWREYLRANTSVMMPRAPEWGWIDSHPMVNISWNDIMGIEGQVGYCTWASRVSGIQLLISTEAQWEYSAKGGKEQKYPWGNEFDESKTWSSVKRRRRSTAPVHRLSNIFTNKFGVSDLLGNIRHWCLDGYQPYTKKLDRLGYVVVSKDPVIIGERKIIRGGSWDSSDPSFLRSSLRIFPYREISFYNVGFRLVAPT